MQSLEIISVNFWQILISLCNLLILFLILKRLLFKPVKKVLADRQSTLDARYAQAEADRAAAESLRAQWTEKMDAAALQAEDVVRRAAETAEARKAEILAETHERAEVMLRQAEEDARLERRKAQAGIRKEIVDVSSAISEKLLGRAINDADQRRLIDSFLDDMEAGDDVNS